MELAHDGSAMVTCVAATEGGGKGSDMEALVCISYSELLDPTSDLSDKIEKAFGPSGLGALSVSDIPHVIDMRRRLLTLAHEFATLPVDVKKLYEDPSSSYNFGWSHGMESLANGKKDTHKGSFYANPLVDAPPCDQELKEKYPAYFHPNIWPTKHLPELEVAFKELGRLIMDVGMLLTERCDRYIESKTSASGEPSGKLQSVLKRSSIPKGRLLHYFPPPTDTEGGEAAPGDSADKSTSWCGWHTDHGSLTGLLSALYLDSQGQEVASPDPDAGLYISSRHGSVVKANILPSHIGYQVGESTQIMSGGLLRATPHYVKSTQGGSNCAGISRNTLAVFMQPDVLEPMGVPQGVSEADVAVGQWRPGQNFGEFSVETFKQYY
eukprot:gene21443-28410_t